MNSQDKIAHYENSILHKRVRLEALVFSERKSIKRCRAAFAVAVPALIFGITFSRTSPALRVLAGGAARLALRFGVKAARGG